MRVHKERRLHAGRSREICRGRDEGPWEGRSFGIVETDTGDAGAEKLESARLEAKHLACHPFERERGLVLVADDFMEISAPAGAAARRMGWGQEVPETPLTLEINRILR